jgi:hypothetical protein
VIESKIPRHIYTQPQLYKIFVVSPQTTVCDIIQGLKRAFKMNERQAVFLVINQRVVTGSRQIGEMYDAYSEEDGFMYAEVQ